MSYNQSVDRLKNILDELREKCPWDKKQTIHTLRQQTIEEVYELADAITATDWKALKEELGDVLLHIMFYSKIAEEQEHFTLGDVVNGVCNKLVARHPHVYGSLTLQNEEQVKQNWEKLKLKEGRKSVLEGVPGSLPAIVKAARLQDKTKQVGFEWENKEQVKEKLDEELLELQQAIQGGQQDEIEDEFGDVLFSMVNYARFLQVDPENALERTNQKFMRRFRKIEEAAAAGGKAITDLSLAEMDAIWNAVKKQEIKP